MPVNPPAFPRTGEGVGNPRYDVAGMDLRDWFAGQAMTGFCATLSGATVGSSIYYLQLAKDAYGVADAMLAERERSNG